MSLIVTLFLLIAVVGGGYVVCYNGLVNARFKVDEGWSGITVQLKRRHALVPNLVDAAKTALGHEEAILQQVIDARESALQALANNDQDAMNHAESGLTAALGKFVSYTESNPELKATENVALLQRQLEETEDQIAAARRIFNANVQAYNTKVMSIPWSMIASAKGFTLRDMFEVDETEMALIAQDPSVSTLGLGHNKELSS